MAWVKLDDGFFFHQKARTVGKDGQLLFLAGLCWAAQGDTEGIVPKRDLPLVAATVGVKPSVASRLVDAVLWEPHPDGWAIHDYHDYNPSAEAIKERRRKRAEAGRKGGLKSRPPGSKKEASASDGQEANDEANNEAGAKPNGTPSSSPSYLHPQTTSSGSRPSARREGNRNSTSNQMVTDWGQVLRLASQGNHTWRDHPDLSPIARAAAAEVAIAIRHERADTARVAFYDAWKRLALEGVS